MKEVALNLREISSPQLANNERKMKSKFGKLVMSVAALVAASVVSANATMTLKLDDNAGHSMSLNDGGTGFIAYFGGLPGSIWAFNIDVALSKPIIGGPFDPKLDVSIQQAYSTKAGTLTVTVISDGFGPFGSNMGTASLLGGGAGANGSITVTGLINGSSVTGLGFGPLTANPWSGSAEAPVTGLGSPFSIGEKIEITHAGQGYGKKGDIFLTVTPVPEPTTLLAGALLLLPFGLSTLRIVRKQ
jgi:hypothetical protein